MLPSFFARTALIVAGLFVLAGAAAVFGTPGLIFAIVMPGVQAIWIAAAISLAVSGHAGPQSSAPAHRSTQPPPQG